MIRKADINDAEAIRDLVNRFAAEELMLPRALNDIYEHLRDFFVCVRDGELIGCGALHVSWSGLGEVRSMAVARDAQHQGVGTQLVEACLSEARAMGMARVFVLTYVPEFFSRFGFQDYPKDKLPHKIWADCLQCPKFPDCDELAMTLELGEG